VTLCETEQLDRIVEAVTNYVAQRLIERERALAADGGWRSAPTEETSHGAIEPAAAASWRPRRLLVRLFVFLVDLLGVAVLFALIAAAVWYVYKLQVPG
jgi:hypothetical protein